MCPTTPNHHRQDSQSRDAMAEDEQQDNYNSSNNNNSSNNSRYPERRNQEAATAAAASKSPPTWHIKTFLLLLAIDLIVSVVLLSPLVPKIRHTEAATTSIFLGGHYIFYAALWDLSLLSALRIIAALLALCRSYFQNNNNDNNDDERRYPFELFHLNGERKSSEELEQEALEEPCGPAFSRFVSRKGFLCEGISFISGLWIIVKCLARLNVEIASAEQPPSPQHPVFWIAICTTAILSVVEMATVDSMETRAGEIGTWRRKIRQQRHGRRLSSSSSPFMRRIASSSLLRPLLPVTLEAEEEESSALLGNDVENPERSEHDDDNESIAADPNNVRGVSDIAADPTYKAGWTDLLGICYPDALLITLAFLCLLAAAVAQVYIPKFTGNILDALVSASQQQQHQNDTSTTDYDVYNYNYEYEYDNNYDNDEYKVDPLFMLVSFLSGRESENNKIWKVPGFIPNVEKLIVAAILGGIFSGLRGSIFTLVGGRANARLRIMLMDSLLSQDIGFFDVTKTGDITSRLSSDTTLVGDQVTLNVNVFLRSFVQAVGVLIFMFMMSWQLSLLAFISVPVITMLSRWYGQYVRKLTKLMQKKLADGNSVSEAAIGAMSTVRAFGAEGSELDEFEKCMSRYLSLNVRSAIAYCGYATCFTAMPQLVTALVLFYGGLLVQSTGSGHISSGQLVSFLLYLSSLSDAFNSIGSIFASLTQAVGAADKVFELIHRKPRITPPTPVTTPTDEVAHSLTNTTPTTTTASTTPACPERRRHRVLGITTRKATEHRYQGFHPITSAGQVSLRGVHLYYPARPKRRVLDGISLTVPPGAVAALVGASGGGKSSVISLLQHLYEPSKGDVCIDGVNVIDYSPEWLSRNVAVVSQEPTLWGRSVRQNIMYGLEGTEFEPSQAAIEEAARLANASEFIESLPFRYDTDVGERGVQLSGGQRQRLAIARALVRKPRILLLDEATSALDAESEALVQEAIDHMLLRGRGEEQAESDVSTPTSSSSMTVLVVAHRLSTVRNADIIFVLDEGKVAEEGTHEELISRENGTYASLVSRQINAQAKLT